MYCTLALSYIHLLNHYYICPIPFPSPHRERGHPSSPPIHKGSAKRRWLRTTVLGCMLLKCFSFNAFPKCVQKKVTPFSRILLKNSHKLRANVYRFAKTQLRRPPIELGALAKQKMHFFLPLKRHLGTLIGGSTGSVMRLRVVLSVALSAGRRQTTNRSNARRHLTWTSLVNHSHALFFTRGSNRIRLHAR